MADDAMEWVPRGVAPASLRDGPAAVAPPPASPSEPPSAPPPATAAPPAQAPGKTAAATAPAAAAAKPGGKGKPDAKPISPLPNRPITGADLKAWLKEAIDRQREGDVEGAIALMHRVLNYKPDDATTWMNLGVLYRRHKNPDMALACYERAKGMTPNNAGLWGNIGNAYKDLEKYDLAIAAHQKAVELEPKTVGLWHNYALCLTESGKPEQALPLFDQILAQQSDHIDAHWDRAMTSLRLGNFSERTWQDYDWRWRLQELANYRAPTTAPLWRGEKLMGRTLMVYSEQGFGDTLFALRYLHRLRGLDGKVILRCQPDLMRLVSKVADFCELASARAATPPHDLALPIMSLIGLYTRAIGDIPPPPELTIPEGAGAKALPRLAIAGDKLKVGIIWSGSVTFRGNARRAVTFERFLRFARIPGVQLFSLQKGPPFEEYRKLAPHPLVVDLGSHFADFADTAAVLKQLDLVVMTDSSVAHLAGSLGVPIWDLLNHSCYWIFFLNREDSPWYPSMRLIRQKTPGDWDELFERVARDLEKLAVQRIARAAKK
jgi:tetratricopeptide (TPR) repeat protein